MILQNKACQKPGRANRRYTGPRGGGYIGMVHKL